MTTTTVEHDLADVLADGSPSPGAPEILEVGDYTIRVIAEPDYDHTVHDDGDWYGTISPVLDGFGYRDTRRRPAGFDGFARKIHLRDGGYVWWQPPDDAKNNPDLVTSLRRSLIDLFEYGYTVLGVQIDRRCDCCGQNVRLATSYLGGVACTDLRDGEFVYELLCEALDEIGTEHADRLLATWKENR